MNIAVAQSGGPTCAINSSLAGVFTEAFRSPQIDKIYGAVNGIEGIINDELVDLKSYLKTRPDIELLRHTPSTFLGSCRVKLAEYQQDNEVYEKILNCFKKYDIKIFFYIGGNDSMDTVAKLSAYMKNTGNDIQVIGIPKTIDNDLMYTDHTPGFGSAAKYVNASVQEIVRDSSVYSIKSVTLVEIMGRHAGWLTASTCLLRVNGEVAPQLIYLPESEFSVEKFIADLRKLQQKHKAIIVAVSEGIEIDGSRTDSGNAKDAFGHLTLSGIGKKLEAIVKEELKCKVRSIELNVMQRCASHLGSKTDIDEAEEIGIEAVRAGLRGETGIMMIFKRVSNNPYSVRIESIAAEKAANKEKFFPKEWINDEGNNVKDEAIEYFLPLIQGELNILMKNGIPIHFEAAVPNRG